MVKTGLDTAFEDFQMECWQNLMYKSEANYTEQELYDLKAKLDYIKNADVFENTDLIPTLEAFEFIKKFAEFGSFMVEAVMCSYNETGKYAFDYIKQWIEPISTDYYQNLFDTNQAYNNP